MDDNTHIRLPLHAPDQQDAPCCGAGGNTATKTEQAERLILDLLADGKELASEDIDKAAAEAGISARTVRAAKKNLDGRITSKRIGAAWYHALKK